MIEFKNASHSHPYRRRPVESKKRSRKYIDGRDLIPPRGSKQRAQRLGEKEISHDWRLQLAKTVSMTKKKTAEMRKEWE